MKKRFIGKKYSVKNVYGKDRYILFILAISMSFSALLFLLGILTLLGITGVPENIIEGTDFLIFGLLSSIGPIGFYSHLKIKKKKDIENQLPDFLLEISSSTASGMTIYDSINAAARGDHGRLTSELQMMSAQLSWGI